ncbi:MAG: hypothetical protein ACTS7C_00540, partial [Candidatus Hodgkinia cicadicola]
GVSIYFKIISPLYKSSWVLWNNWNERKWTELEKGSSFSERHFYSWVIPKLRKLSFLPPNS